MCTSTWSRNILHYVYMYIRCKHLAECVWHATGGAPQGIGDAALTDLRSSPPALHAHYLLVVLLHLPQDV